MERDRNSVAVIGLGKWCEFQVAACKSDGAQLGALGLVAVKNLMEEGFDVTGFDKNEYVGGLWHYTEENKTSVLPSMHLSKLGCSIHSHYTATIVNISKERVC